MASKKFRKLRVCPILGSPKDLNPRNLPTQEEVLLSVIYEKRISKTNGMHAKDILKAAVVGGCRGMPLEKRLEICIYKAENTNHQCEMHQETYMPVSFSATSTTASRCQKEAN
jgi:hypothetical protein